MSLKSNKFLYIRLPLFLWSATILTLTSIPGTEMPEINLWNWDKLAHCFVYIIFAILLMRYLLDVRGFTLARAWRRGIFIGTLFGALDEIHQLFIPFRECAWQDFLADFAGILIGAYLAFWYFRRKAEA